MQTKENTKKIWVDTIIELNEKKPFEKASPENTNETKNSS